MTLANEQPGVAPALPAQATALGDRLGLTPNAIRMLTIDFESASLIATRIDRTDSGWNLGTVDESPRKATASGASQIPDHKRLCEAYRGTFGVRAGLISA
jgi:hypothetical protein